MMNEGHQLLSPLMNMVYTYVYVRLNLNKVANMEVKYFIRILVKVHAK